MSTKDILQPGQVIDLPDYDLSQTPVITNQQWAGVPTGMTGNTVNYGNAGAPAVPSFAPPAVPSFTGNGKNTRGGVGSKPYGPAAPPTTNPFAAQFNAAMPGRVSNQAPAALPQGTGYSGGSTLPTGDPFSGIPGASRQQGTASNIHTGAAWQGGAAPTASASASPMAALVNFTRTSQAGARPQARPTNVGDPFSGIPSAARQTGVHTGAAFQGGPAANTATPGQPAPTPVMDRAYIAEAARYTGLAIYEFGRTGNRNQLPNRINARVAAELPFMGAGYASIDEFMAALGYRLDADGNWTRYDPQVVSSYRPQTYSAGSSTYDGGGGGGGLTRGPAYGYGSGYGNQGAGLVNWRIGTG